MKAVELNERKISALEKFVKKQKVAVEEQTEGTTVIDATALMIGDPKKSATPWGTILVKKGDSQALIFDELKARYGELIQGDNHSNKNVFQATLEKPSGCALRWAPKHKFPYGDIEMERRFLMLAPREEACFFKRE